MRRAWMVFLVAVGLVLAPRLVGAQRLTAGYISKDLNYLPFFIAQKKGFHAKEGIAVELVNIGRSDIPLQALVAGELHFANINADNVIIWNERTGGNLKVAAGSSNAAVFADRCQEHQAHRRHLRQAQKELGVQ